MPESEWSHWAKVGREQRTLDQRGDPQELMNHHSGFKAAARPSLLSSRVGGMVVSESGRDRSDAHFWSSASVSRPSILVKTPAAAMHARRGRRGGEATRPLRQAGRGESSGVWGPGSGRRGSGSSTTSPATTGTGARSARPRRGRRTRPSPRSPHGHPLASRRSRSFASRSAFRRSRVPLLHSHDAVVEPSQPRLSAASGDDVDSASIHCLSALPADKDELAGLAVRHAVSFSHLLLRGSMSSVSQYRPCYDGGRQDVQQRRLLPGQPLLGRLGGSVVGGFVKSTSPCAESPCKGACLPPSQAMPGQRPVTTTPRPRELCESSTRVGSFSIPGGILAVVCRQINTHSQQFRCGFRSDR